jgi:CDP-diacylglycerol---serine O-phosphatidyltransferase
MSWAADRFSLVRGLKGPDYLTLANALCGMFAIFCALARAGGGNGTWLIVGVALVGSATVFDTFDGRLARWLGITTMIGRELDALADLISFGVAPAALGNASGLHGPVAVAALAFYVACAVCRLARYNASIDRLAASTGKVPYFEGTPVTFGIVPLGLAVALSLAGGMHGVLVVVASLVFAVTGCAMISRTLRIPKP